MRSIVALMIAFAMLGASAAMAAEVIYREDFGPPDEPEKMLGGGLLLGRSGAWSGAVENQRYILENDKRAGAAYLNFAPLDARYDMRRAGITVTIQAQSRAKNYGAGILYDYDKAAQHYWAFTVRDGAYLVLRRGDDGLHQIAEGEVDGLDLSQPTQLLVAGKGSKLYFFVNHHAVATVDFAPDATALAQAERGVGFIAFGLGRFSFDDFAVAIE